MTLLEALEHAKGQDKFCVVTRLGTHTKVDLDTEDISKYVIYITEREIQRYTNVWYYSLYVIIDRPTCKWTTTYYLKLNLFLLPVLNRDCLRNRAIYMHGDKERR